MKILHDLHLHSRLSDGAEPHATVENYLVLAKEYGLSAIGIADYLWDTKVSAPCDEFYEDQDAKRILSMVYPKEKGIRILRGCEVEMDEKGRLGISEETAKKMDFILATHSHSHIEGAIPDAIRRDKKKLAELLCDRFSLLIENPMAKYITAVAHPFYPTGNPDNFDEVLFRIPDDRLEDLFNDAVYKNIAIELSASAFSSYPMKSMHRSELFRIYETAKECGCKFTFGSDCHDPDMLAESLQRLEILTDILEITAADICPLVNEAN